MAENTLTKALVENKFQCETKSKQQSRMNALITSILNPNLIVKQEYEGHQDTIKACIMTSNYSHAFSASNDKLIKIWEISTGAHFGDLLGHDHWINDLAITSNDQKLISGSEDRRVIVWDWMNKTLEKIIDYHPCFVYCIALSFDDQYLISGGGDGKIHIWNMKLETSLSSITFGDHIYRAAWTKDNKEIIAVGRTGKIGIFNFESKSCLATLKANFGNNFSVTLTPDNSYLFVGTEGGKIKVWNYPSLSEYWLINSHEAQVNRIICTRNNKYAITASLDKTIRIFNIKLKVEEIKLYASSSIYGLDLSKDEQFITIGCGDGNLEFWKIGTNNRKRICSSMKDPLNQIAISRDREWIIAGVGDKRIQIFKFSNLKLEEIIKLGDFVFINIVVTQKYFFVASKSYREIWMFDINTLSQVCLLQGHEMPPSFMAASDNDNFLASSDISFKIILWDLNSRSMIAAFNDHTGIVPSLLFFNHTENFISGSHDKTFRIFNKFSK